MNLDPHTLLYGSDFSFLWLYFLPRTQDKLDTFEEFHRLWVKDLCLDRPLALSPMIQVGIIINTSEVYSIEHASNVASSQPIIEVVT
jgi:hypothetical protein